MFPPWTGGNGPNPELEDQIRETLYKRTCRKEDIQTKFVSYSELKRIWTWQKITEFFNGLSWFNEDLTDIIRKRFLRILSILVYIRWQDWPEFQRIFMDPKDDEEEYTRADDCLPLNQLEQFEFLPTEEFRQRMHAAQYIFNPVSFKYGESTYYASNQRLPFVFMEEIASGASSTVFKAQIARHHFLGEDGEPNSEVKDVAVKKIRFHRSFKVEVKASEEFVRSVTSHKRIMKNICSISYDTTVGSEYHILYEVADMNLQQLLSGPKHGYPKLARTEQNERRYLDFQASDMFSEAAALAGALHWLHNEIYDPRDPHPEVRAAHNDLKPENVLIVPNYVNPTESPVGQWKIADFGISTISKGVGENSTSKRTENLYNPVVKNPVAPIPDIKDRKPGGSFVAPEFDSDDGRDCDEDKLDIWSFGCVLAYVLSFACGGRVCHALCGPCTPLCDEGCTEECQTNCGPGECGRLLKAALSGSSHDDSFWTFSSTHQKIIKPSIVAYLHDLVRKDPQDFRQQTVKLIFDILIHNHSGPEAVTQRSRFVSKPEDRPTAVEIKERLDRVAELCKRALPMHRNPSIPSFPGPITVKEVSGSNNAPNYALVEFNHDSDSSDSMYINYGTDDKSSDFLTAISPCGRLLALYKDDSDLKVFLTLSTGSKMWQKSVPKDSQTDQRKEIVFRLDSGRKWKSVNVFFPFVTLHTQETRSTTSKDKYWLYKIVTKADDSEAHEAIQLASQESSESILDVRPSSNGHLLLRYAARLCLAEVNNGKISPLRTLTTSVENLKRSYFSPDGRYVFAWGVREGFESWYAFHVSSVLKLGDALPSWHGVLEPNNKDNLDDHGQRTFFAPLEHSLVVVAASMGKAAVVAGSLMPDISSWQDVAQNVIAITALQSSNAFVAICENGDVIVMHVDQHGRGSTFLDSPYAAARLKFTKKPKDFSCQLITDIGHETPEQRNVFLLVFYDSGLVELVNVGHLM